MRNRTSPGQPRRRLSIEMLEGRRLLAATPLGAMPNDTAEYMLGTVTVTPVLLESDGSIDQNSEDWTEAEIQQVLANVSTGMQWWVDTLATFNTDHSLEFVIDTSFATTPVDTPYEPITKRSDAYTQYVGQFLADQGYDGSSLTLEDAIRAFNHSQRVKHGTDWAFTIFVVDSSNDADGMFDPVGTFRQAFAFAGGLFFVTPSTRPASTYTHETGHMFWARDEYANSASYYDKRGYYNTQNTNAVDDAPPGFVQQQSIMSSGQLLINAYNSHTSPASTLAQVGWQDSDGDGIFDVLDVPLELDVTAVFQDDTDVVRIRGLAQAVALPNMNSAGLKNDITLNEVSRLQYRVDGGAWETLATPGTQVYEFDTFFSAPSAFNTIEFRALDDALGISSNVVTLTPERPTKGNAIEGYAYVDDNANGQWDAAELLVTGVSLEIANASGIYRGILEPDDHPGINFFGNTTGLTLESTGNQVNGSVHSGTGDAATGANVFKAGSLFGGLSQNWTEVKQQLKVTFDQPTSDVSIMAVALSNVSHARINAYDINGVLISRHTVQDIDFGQSGLLRVHDPQGRIKTVEVFGFAGTSVSLDHLTYGPEISATSSTFGAFEFGSLPDGQYTLNVASTLSQFRVIDPDPVLVVAGGQAQPLVIALERATSRWTNPNNPLDVNNNGIVQPIDALIVINELNRTQPRELGDSDPTPPYLDVNGDLSVTPIDALRIINYLNRGGTSGEGELGGPLGGAPGSGFGTGSSFGTGTGGAAAEGEQESPAFTDKAVAGYRAEFWVTPESVQEHSILPVVGPMAADALGPVAVDWVFGYVEFSALVGRVESLFGQSVT